MITLYKAQIILYNKLYIRGKTMQLYARSSCNAASGRKDGAKAMIGKSNHLGRIVITKRYLLKLVTNVAESCFGVAGLNNVEISGEGGAVDVKLYIKITDNVNLPAIANAVSHKVAYVLTNQTGINVRSVVICADDII